MNTPATASTAVRARTSFASRAAMAVILVGVFGSLVWADANGLGGARPVWWLLPLAVAVAVRGAAEFTRLFTARGVPVRGRLVACLTAVVAVSAALDPAAGVVPATQGPVAAPLGWTTVTTMAAVAALLVAAVARYGRGARALEGLAAGVLVVTWLGLPLAFMVALRLVCVEGTGPGQPTTGLGGILPLVSLFVVVKAGDIAAYVVGSLVGRAKMAPVLSPGKTWEGAAASLAGSLAAAWLVIERTGLPVDARPWGGWPVFGLAVGTAGMLGDLAESLVKRELEAKDSGRLLGGLGGVLDLVDSLLLAAPVAWVLWVMGG